MALLPILLFVGAGIVALIVIGAVVAWVLGSRLQSGSQTARQSANGDAASSSSPQRLATNRLAEIDALVAEVRKRLDKDVDDPELIASLGRHLDDLQAKKEAAADRLSDLKGMLDAPIAEERRLKAEVASLATSASASPEKRADLERKQASLEAVSKTIEQKRKEQASLNESLDRIADGLREVRDRLSRAPDSGEIASGVADSLSALHGELDAQERARREIAALEKAT